MNTLVSDVKARREVGVSFMRFGDYIESIKREVKEEALAEGRLEAAASYISLARSRHHASDEDILQDLTGHFGLTEDEAQALLAEKSIEAVVQ